MQACAGGVQACAVHVIDRRVPGEIPGLEFVRKPPLSNARYGLGGSAVVRLVMRAVGFLPLFVLLLLLYLKKKTDRRA